MSCTCVILRMAVDAYFGHNCTVGELLLWHSLHSLKLDRNINLVSGGQSLQTHSLKGTICRHIQFNYQTDVTVDINSETLVQVVSSLVI